MIQARADKLFDTAATSSGCEHPLIAENELSGANLPTPWTPTTAQYRSNVLAYLQRLDQLGARPFLLLPKRPYTHDGRRRLVAPRAGGRPRAGGLLRRAGDLEAGGGAGSRRLRATMRTRMEDLIQIGVPTNRLGMMLTFARRPWPAAARDCSRSRSGSTSKWEALAAKQVAAELDREHLVVGLGVVQPGGQRPRQAGGRLHVALDARPLALRRAGARGDGLDQSLDVGAVLPSGTVCVLGRTRCRDGRRCAQPGHRRP